VGKKSCILVGLSNIVSLTQAEAACQSQGGSLASILNEAEQEQLYSLTFTNGSEARDRWIGLSDRASLQTFGWSDGNPVLYTRWGLGYPITHAGSSPSCVFMLSDMGLWAHTR
jgi:Lectin C-type domain